MNRSVASTGWCPSHPPRTTSARRSSVMPVPFVPTGVRYRSASPIFSDGTGDPHRGGGGTRMRTPAARREEDPAMPTLLSVNVGRPANVDWHGRTVYTGIWKSPVTGARMARRLNLDGDGQGDLGGHGGEQRAVLAYQIESYRHWQEFFGRDTFEYGQFGDNFTVDGLSDEDVCIGDRYRIGAAEFEVTQPRVTCFRVGLRMNAPQLPALLVSHRRPGFYLRVITEGEVRAGDEITRTRQGPHGLSVADADALL